MASIVTRIFHVLVGISLTLLFEPLLSSLFLILEIDTASWAQPIVDGVRNISGNDYFRLSAAMIIGIAIGIWIKSKIEQSKKNIATSFADRIYNLVIRLASLVADIQILVQKNSRMMQDEEIFNIPLDVRQEYRSICIELKKLDIIMPNLVGFHGTLFASVASRSIENIIPYLRANQISEAIVESIKFNDTFEENRISLLERMNNIE